MILSLIPPSAVVGNATLEELSTGGLKTLIPWWPGGLGNQLRQALVQHRKFTATPELPMLEIEVDLAMNVAALWGDRAPRGVIAGMLLCFAARKPLGLVDEDVHRLNVATARRLRERLRIREEEEWHCVEGTPADLREVPELDRFFKLMVELKDTSPNTVVSGQRSVPTSPRATQVLELRRPAAITEALRRSVSEEA